MRSAADQRLTSAFGADTPAREVIAGIDLTGQRAIVTGGASGIGTVTAAALASAGAEVTIAARNLDAGRAVADDINARMAQPHVAVAQLDLADLRSVRDFAAAWGQKPLNLLINNAGVMACPYGRTADGFETQFGTNHLGHFLLTVLLLPALQAGAPARVVALSSAAHKFSDIDFDDPNFEHRPYRPFKAYGQSKTANALFAVEFDRRYRDRGIDAFSVMPGVIQTNLGRHLTPELREKISATPKTATATSPMTYKSVEAGAATTVWAATAPELAGRGGRYLEDCAEALPFSPDLPDSQGVMPHALDPETARRLWELSERMVGLA